MICEKCREEGKKSRVTSSGGFSTLMTSHPYYDEEGVYHIHDMNVNTDGWSCSNGHKWQRKYQSKCPANGCEWNSARMDKTWTINY